MLVFVFSGNPGPAWNHECCASRKDLATKDRVATVKLVSYEWYGHWCKGRVVERIVGVTVVYFSHFSDIFQHSLFAFSLIFRYVLCLFPSISLAFYGHFFYLIPAILIYRSNPILLSFPFISSKFSYHTLGNETSY